MPASTEESLVLSDPARVELPPLRVHHFLLLTAVTAFVFTGFQLISHSLGGEFSVPSVLQLPWLLMGGFSLAALGIVVVYRLRGGRQWQPGHGLLVMQSIALLSTLVILACFSWLPTGPFWAFQWIELGTRILTVVVAICLAVYPGGLNPWRWVFVLLALRPIYSVVVNMLISGFLTSDNFALVHTALDLVSQIVISLFVIGGVMADQRRNTWRHWTHWAGVGVFFGFLAHGIAMTVFFCLFPYDPGQ